MTLIKNILSNFCICLRFPGNDHWEQSTLSKGLMSSLSSRPSTPLFSPVKFDAPLCKSPAAASPKSSPNKKCPLNLASGSSSQHRGSPTKSSHRRQSSYIGGSSLRCLSPRRRLSGLSPRFRHCRVSPTKRSGHHSKSGKCPETHCNIFQYSIALSSNTDMGA